MLILAGIAGIAPMPYAVMQPGPVRDVLSTTSGQPKGEPMISISGRRTYPTSGRLDMLTVAITGGPGTRVTLPEVVAAWFNRADSVQPVDKIYPKTESRKQVEKQNAAAMDSSQENATAAALRELNIQVPTRLRIGAFSLDSSAKGVLKVSDEILAINDHPVGSMTDLRSRVRAHPAGSTVSVTVRRDGVEAVKPVKLVQTEEKQPALGVLMDPTYSFPFRVRISIESVGGPSAGTMFALGIVDKLTPGPLAGGKHISGTGAIDAEGNVQPIGGIRQKLVGARDAGAAWFLAPAANCNEVVRHVPKGLRVVRVSTLHQAHVSVQKIAAGQTSDLPTCG